MAVACASPYIPLSPVPNVSAMSGRDGARVRLGRFAFVDVWPAASWVKFIVVLLTLCTGRGSVEGGFCAGACDSRNSNRGLHLTESKLTGISCCILLSDGVLVKISGNLPVCASRRLDICWRWSVLIVHFPPGQHPAGPKRIRSMDSSI